CFVMLCIELYWSWEPKSNAFHSLPTFFHPTWKCKRQMRINTLQARRGVGTRLPLDLKIRFVHLGVGPRQ
ncbi:MAG: hypothetical protein AB7P49_20400, partial [Bdellovibrionales bacterium]